MQAKVLETIEEQTYINFTGKINILKEESNQLLGAVIMLDGQLVNTKFQDCEGLKAFYNLCIAEDQGESFDLVLEPELIDQREIKIDHPFSVLKRRLIETISRYKESLKNKPPNNLKLVLIPEFLTGDQDVSQEEYSLMCTLSDYNLVSDIYKKSPLLDFEITNALVLLRKKNAIKVIEIK